MNGILLALGVGFLYYLAYLEMHWMQNFFKEAVVLGAVIGLMLGDFKTGLIMGGSFQLLYIAGVMAPGGNLSVDPPLAACVAIPIAMQTGMDVEMAMVMAIPFGLLGVFLDNFRRTVMGYWTRRADKHAEAANTKAILFDGIGGPILFNIPLRLIPVALITYLGADAATYIVEAMPAWLSNGLSVAGGMLPAVGLAMILQVLNKKFLLLYFLAGTLITRMLSMPIIVAALFGGIFACLHVMFTRKAEAPADGQ